MVICCPAVDNDTLLFCYAVRYGFPLVPDFGGTAHAYCGSTLSTCLGDLLPWDQKLSYDAALRGYIVNSRVKCVSKILVAQPYSPELFAQGEQLGPFLLLEVVLKHMSCQAAKVAWKKIEREEAQTKTRSDKSWLNAGDPLPTFLRQG